MNKNISIIGGSGHVGMPLAIKFASKGFKVFAIDKNRILNKKLSNGIVPFNEEGAKKMLIKALKRKKITFTNDYAQIKNSKYIIITVGTPVTKKNKPNMKIVIKVFNQIKNYLKPHQSIILRSTLYPGTSKKIISELKKKKIRSKVSYCPERVAQGKSIQEIENLPQIISAEDKKEEKKIHNLFRKICKKTISLNFIEAEYSKLFSNAWRYIKFAVSNEFFMISNKKGFDYNKVYNAIKLNYPRNHDLPNSGFAAGPCLPKDAIQLWNSCKSHSDLVYGSYKINQYLPKFLVSNLNKSNKVKNKYVGILGTTFKGEIDDERDSLSLDLKKELIKLKAKVITYDPFINKNTINLKKILKKCQIIFIGTPHKSFKKINFKNKHLIDCWNFIN